MNMANYDLNHIPHCATCRTWQSARTQNAKL